ncbi:glycosyltransferase family 2 protein [Amphritea sp. HPY]|uniref:glycosyltransferase family 2 protein n=1 Tax=Amphritea sp. HPY TaxID=3421652 RepID=UPI003D7C888E
MNPHVNIVFVCFNCGQDIQQAISDIVQGDYPLDKLSITVVDNASQDNSVKLLTSIDCIDVNVIESTENVGFGSGCNLAISQVNGGDKVLLLNPDIRLNVDSISKLIEYSNETPEALIWGGKTLDENGNVDGKNAWKEPSLSGVISWSFFGDILFKKLGLSIPDAYSEKELFASDSVDAISGCFFLIDLNLLKQLGGFDEQFFMYSEEVDLCRRARELGAQPKSTTSATIVHIGSKTITSRNKLNFLYESKLKYFKKHWSPLKFYVARVSLFLGSFLRLVLISSASLFMASKRNDRSIWFEFVKNQLSWRF